MRGKCCPIEKGVCGTKVDSSIEPIRQRAILQFSLRLNFHLVMESGSIRVIICILHCKRSTRRVCVICARKVETTETKSLDIQRLSLTYFVQPKQLSYTFL